MRLCPKCGKKTQEARCPDDGTATLVLAQNPDAKLVEGTEVNGRYRIDKVIGQGGFGAVYKAKNMATDQDIAIKLLAVSLDSDDSDMIQRFFAEAQVTASLKHPNTIRVFDFGQTEGGALYIAMELLYGRPLNEELRDRVAIGQVFSEEEIIVIGSQVLRSLAEAHTANLVHRDLKPHNIFMHQVEGDDSVIKVLDFGIAKKLGTNMTGTGKAFGTPTYMSPEQAQNRAVDRRSDLYSLGCVFYQLAAGRPPFDGENPLSVLLSHVADAPPDLRQTARTPVSELFVRLVERALSKSAEERFATAMEMRQALEACRGADRSESARQQAISAGQPATNDNPDAATNGYDAVAEPARTLAYQVKATPRAGEKPIPAPPLGRAPEAVGLSPSIIAPTALSGTVATIGPARPVSNVAVPKIDFSPTEREEEFAEPSSPATGSATNKGSKAPLVLVVAGVVVALVIAVVLMTGGTEDPQDTVALVTTPTTADPVPTTADPVPTTADPVPTTADPVPTPAVAAVAAPVPPQAVAKVAEGPAAGPVIPAGPIMVELTTEPEGADVLVNGKVIGQTPFGLRVTAEETVTASLHLEGFADKDVEVQRRNFPKLKASLRKLSDDEAKAAAAKKREARPKTGPKKPVDKPSGENNILEERLN
ncbi:MAG: serine/threonine protein kinase [Myxococcales bacterium]|nr:serine/threonine protein kinase [Myxococcales bacterium]